ncbi:MAG TPA: hypothetical protein VEI97_11265, partial [bacterium]|nr:hypothetical protein [bacterium]
MSATRFTPTTVPQTLRSLPAARPLPFPRAGGAGWRIPAFALPAGREAAWWLATLALALGGWMAQALVTFNPARGTAPAHHLLSASHELLNLALGLAAGYCYRFASPARRRALAVAAMGASVLLLGWVLLYGFANNGAQRWIRIA